MKALAAFAGLEGLFDLAADGNGVDMYATLLRVLTDLYLQRPIHTPEDEHYYTELALRLIDATEVSERAALAARLASYPSAPQPVLERLARDVVEVAGPILERSPWLGSAEVKALAEASGNAHGESIATSPGGAPQAAQAPAAVNVAEASELSELFYAAKAPERRLILINLDYAPLIASQPLPDIQRTDVWRLESAALEHNAETLICELERMLGISRAQARRIVNDELGEPIVVVAKAMELPADALQGLLLFWSRWIGQPVDRVCELADLYGEISTDAAYRLIAIWREDKRAESEPVQHEGAAWRAAAEKARRALCEVSRPPDLPDDARLRSGERSECAQASAAQATI
jgi:hypothetical protein